MRKKSSFSAPSNVVYLFNRNHTSYSGACLFFAMVCISDIRSTIARMLENREYDQLKQVVAKYGDAIEETKVKKYCENVVLDAVFSSYLSRTVKLGIQITTNIRLPEVLPVSEEELATVFANAIENAIHACEKIETGIKTIDIKVLSSPNFMFRIENSFNGDAEFDNDGIPLSHQEEHGFGTRSIVAFCNKNDAFYEFKTHENIFTLQIIF